MYGLKCTVVEISVSSCGFTVSSSSQYDLMQSAVNELMKRKKRKDLDYE